MNGRTRRLAAQQGTAGSRTPWFLFLFLTAVFFFVQHDWYFSLSAAVNFNRTLDELTKATEQGNLTRRVSFLFLGVFALAGLLKWGFRRLTVNGPLGWLVLFLLSWAFLSLTWSHEPAFTARRLLGLAASCLGAFAVSRRFSLRETMLWVLLSTLVYLHLGIAAEITLGTFHPLSAGYRFSGTLHPNVQGINCALLLITSVLMLMSEKRLRHLLCLTACEALVFLVLTKSRTSFVLAVFIPVLYWFLISGLSRKGAAVLAGVSIPCLVILLGDEVFPALQHAVLLGRGDSDIGTLTGRLPIWQQAWSYIANRPIRGYGYDAFWTPGHMVEFWKEQRWAVPNAHSAYVDCTLGLGMVGGASLILIVVTAVRRALAARKPSRNVGYGFLGCVLAFSALNGLLESVVIQPSHIAFVSMLAVATLGFPSLPPGRVGEARRRGRPGAEARRYNRSRVRQGSEGVSS